jgi:hypothetical protein
MRCPVKTVIPAMKSSKQTTRASSRSRDSEKSPKSNFSWLPLVVFIVGAALLTWMIVRSFSPPVGQSPRAASPESIEAPPGLEDPSEAGEERANEPEPLSEALRQKLLGNWQRTDADYAIEIRLVSPDGVADARYFNPFNQRSVNVEKSSVIRRDGQAEFFMVLRDVGYPGSTYTLVYDEANDLFNGIYYQAAMQQSFDVSFARVREE